ncbi:proline--tRNA ligase [Candidatus Dojkabacteria bacterium]|nr:proline--tRNA ligase [Candidatus Dojkabacteria bacterium]
MKYTQLFGKTQKESRELETKNMTLLSKGGFINQHMAGVYTYLPLGYRVVAKIEDIIRDEMNKVNGQELRLPSLHSARNWKQTGRWDTHDTLFRFKSYYSKLDLAFCPTHEELVTPLAKEYTFSYKDLPFSLYQIQTKFRDEKRPTLGLSRLREFRMKDMYSFHASREDLYDYYEEVKQAYWNIFKRVGLDDITYITLASGGDFTDEYSHEFQTAGRNGQDLIFHCKSCNITYNREVAPSKIPSQCCTGEKEKPMKAVLGKGIKGVEELAKFLKIEVERTTKTLLYETEKENVIAVAVRGDYNVNEEKLKKVTGYKELKLASKERVKKVTGAEIGYAGIVDLPEDIEVYVDDSLKSRKNFECGANKTDYHNINVNFGRDLPKPKKYLDFKLSREGDICPKCGQKYEVIRALENGNIFPLEKKFSKFFNLYYTDKEGTEQIVYMGCYGIGPDRIISSIVENKSDDKGIIWPITITPYYVHLISLEDGDIKSKANDLYDSLLKEGIEILWDDRDDASAGEKFNDADLIGIPIRIIISKRSLSRDGVEMKLRTEKEGEIIELDKVVDVIKQKIELLKKELEKK